MNDFSLFLAINNKQKAKMISYSLLICIIMQTAVCLVVVATWQNLCFHVARGSVNPYSLVELKTENCSLHLTSREILTEPVRGSKELHAWFRNCNVSVIPKFHKEHCVFNLLLLLCMNLESRVGARGDDTDSLCSALFFVFLTPKGFCPKSINSRSHVAEACQSFSLCPPNSGLERLTY